MGHDHESPLLLLLTMPTAVLDIDLEKIPPEVVGLHDYKKALVLIRFRSRPVGKAVVEVCGGRICGHHLRDQLLEAAGDLPWEFWLRDFLDWDETKNVRLPSATVAICTRERTTDLAKCLSSLQKLQTQPLEILVIDNAPKTQKTRDLVTQFFPTIRYICEPQTGLDWARNRALCEAQGEVVAFIDDDAIVDFAWLAGLLQNFADPLVACVTGLTMPFELETTSQEWFEIHCPFGKGFRRKIFKGDSHDPFRTGEIGAGVNMAVRREKILELGGFDPALDAGTPTESGGDHEMFSRVLTHGYSIIYEPVALCWHRHRRSPEELRRAVYGYGAGVYALLSRAILIEREWAALKVAVGWFRHDQLPKLIYAVTRRPGREPLDLLFAELRGCVAGPFAYLRSRKLVSNGRAG
ncbi:MAG: glycosyl transferase family 2 [Verrucomicrobiales bacterium]|nr:glycosyl transferase family 2 [Verrucomicrobiales bacterium]